MRAPPLRLQVAASPLLAGVFSLAHGGAIACAILFLPGWWLSALTSAAIAASLVFHVRRDALQLSSHAVAEILLKDGGQCELVLLNGDVVAGNIEGSTFVAPLLTVINVRAPGRGRSRAAILIPGSAPAQDLRRVRVWLRHRARPDTSASGPL